MTNRDPSVVSNAMRKVRWKDTTAELLLRKRLWAEGVRYRLGSKLPGRPDLVFPRQRLTIFVDGDFWHGRQWQTRGFESLEAQMSRVHGSAYWIKKLKRNMQRDQDVNTRLADMGWTVLRLWESDINTDLDQAVSLVLSALCSSAA